MNSRLTDIHQHLLWGLDDGPETMEGTQEMLAYGTAVRFIQ